MKIEGRFVFDGIAPEVVWNFLTDAHRIAECLPGCQKLEQTGEGAYSMQLRFGVGAVSGMFNGSICLHDLQPPSQYQMTVNGSGAAGFVKGEGVVQLAPSDAGALLNYSGDVSPGGPIASLGQRMVCGAARMVIDQFFKSVCGKLTAACSDDKAAAQNPQ